MEFTSQHKKSFFSLMNDLTATHTEADLRELIGHRLLELLDADHFASYIWSPHKSEFESRISINMSDQNLSTYEKHFQFCDPITPTLQKRRSATPVSWVMRHKDLIKTEFYNDFLRRDGLCYGINLYLYVGSRNIGDIRLWRGVGKKDFDEESAKLLDGLLPSLINAISAARYRDGRQYNKEHGGPLANDPSDIVRLQRYYGLTRKETEVASSMLDGLSDAEIAEVLTLSLPTIRTHIRAIFQKTGINRRSQLWILAKAKN